MALIWISGRYFRIDYSGGNWTSKYGTLSGCLRVYIVLIIKSDSVLFKLLLGFNKEQISEDIDLVTDKPYF